MYDQHGLTFRDRGAEIGTLGTRHVRRHLSPAFVPGPVLNPQPGIENRGQGIGDRECGIRDRGQGTGDRGQRTGDRGLRIEDRGQGIRDRGQGDME